MRIVKTRYKVLFVGVWVVVLGVAVGILSNVGLDTAADWVSTLGFAAMTVWAVRVFRVAEEDVAAPRPLWRVTGRPTAGFLLGGLNALSAAIGIWSMIYARATDQPSSFSATFTGGGGLPIQIVSLVVDAVFGFWYLRSSFRLARRTPAPGWAR